MTVSHNWRPQSMTQSPELHITTAEDLTMSKAVIPTCNIVAIVEVQVKTFKSCSSCAAMPSFAPSDWIRLADIDSQHGLQGVVMFDEPHNLLYAIEKHAKFLLKYSFVANS